MTRYWNKPDVPHKGWQLIDCIDTEEAINQCDMCDKENIRYIHKMYHPELPDYLWVGCVCAGHMTDAYTAEMAEKKTRSRTMKKQRWMRDGWNTLPIDDEKVYTYKSVRNTPWGVYELKNGWHYNVGNNHSHDHFDSKESALEHLYKIYQQVYLKKKEP